MNQKELLKKIARQFIPNAGTIAIVIALLWAQQAGALNFLSPNASSTTTISYQGRLADSGGNPINANIGMTFRIYNASTGGSALWTETYPAVQVSNGLFHVLLGSVTPLPNSLFSSNTTLYLGITVGADSEMTPREQLASAPYAMQAGQALTVPDGVITSSKIANSAVKSDHLHLTSGFACLPGGAHTSLGVGGGSEVAIPGLNLSFSLAQPSRVLIWIDIEALYPVTNNETGVFAKVDSGSTYTGARWTNSNSYTKVAGQRLVDLNAGSHSLSAIAFSTATGTMTLLSSGCIGYMVLGTP